MIYRNIVELTQDYAVEVNGKKVLLKKGMKLRVFAYVGSFVEGYVVGRPDVYKIPLTVLKREYLPPPDEVIGGQ